MIRLGLGRRSFFWQNNRDLRFHSTAIVSQLNIASQSTMKTRGFLIFSPTARLVDRN